MHSNQVSAYVAGAAARLGFEPRKREELVFASLLHDIGKIGISERILLKPGPLTPEERLLIELHPRIGFRLVEQIPVLREIAPAVLHHHERWDGDGYPAKLRGEDIPIEARLIGIADAFSSMTSDRPYRSAMSIEEACDELKRCAGTQFDPTIVRYFVEEIRAHPPEEASGEADVLSAALDDPELEARRVHDERLLGDSAFSVVDNLTLLYSHRHLHDVVKAEAARAEVQNRPFGAIVVQLRDIGDVNRERGYAAGDDAIRAVAEAVERLAARCGGTAARESGRRIALVVPGADEEIARKLCDELQAQLDGQGIVAGCAAWRKGDSGDDVLARASVQARNGAGDGNGDGAGPQARKSTVSSGDGSR
jgi:diguanylate cyclase (GGDEF)-like protein